MYDSHGVDLCIMYDSHDVYLRILCTICMYKFSRYHTVIFHDFFSNDRFFIKFDRFLPKFVWKSRGRFSEKKLFDFSLKSADNSAKSAEIRDSEIQLFLCRLQYVLAELS
jgi:hypothetical protein